jgi:TusA-related sulfurtransferase
MGTLAVDRQVGHIDRRIDATALVGTMPVVLAMDAIGHLATGETVELTATDARSWKNLRAWASGTGHELVAFTVDEGDVYRFVIRHG